MNFFGKSDKPSTRYFQKSGNNLTFFRKYGKKPNKKQNENIEEEKEKVKQSPLERRRNPF